ncbi:hypothetical protein ABEB36_000506 [Hypothenemus hampei]|uniref:Uncharacterized protein n=1 Tax=Hypothenemus hampei TaxID=57062 RepID=A0ABD1FBG0_HYPHA
MAIEHFDEHILPKCRDQLELRSGSPEHILKELEVVAGSITPLKKFQGVMYKDLATKQAPRILLQSSPIPNTLSSELRKVKKIAKTHKHHISYLTQNSQRLSLKLRKQNAKLRIQMAKLREQDRKLQEQNAKILEQDAALTEIKKHMEDWEQKYKDLTAELVRARDEILLKTSPSTSSLLSIQRACENSNAHVPFKTNIKPRVAHILPKGYLGMDLERKRKSTLCTELPLKRNRSPSAPTCGSFHKINKNIDVSVIQDQSYFEGSEMSKSASCSSRSLDSENNQETSPDSLKAFLFDNLLSNPLKNRNLKRKLTEDGDVPPPVKKV